LRSCSFWHQTEEKGKEEEEIVLMGVQSHDQTQVALAETIWFISTK
jgi:hypothetical protein